MKFKVKLHGCPLEFVKTRDVWVCVISNFNAEILMPYADEKDYEVLDLILDSHVNILELTVRAENCLKAEGIKTVRQLTETDANFIRYKVPNLGVTTYIEIVKALAHHGLKLKGEVR